MSSPYQPKDSQSHLQSDCHLEYVSINSVPIQIAQLGFHTSIFKSFSPINKSSKSPNICIIFIPGEIGDISLYLLFLKKLHQKTGNMPTIGISHAGHSKITNDPVYDCFSKTCK